MVAGGVCATACELAATNMEKRVEDLILIEYGEEFRSMDGLAERERV